MRCFIGVPLPTTWKEALAALIQCWKPRFCTRLAWTRPATWHVTLRFLGELDSQQVDSVAEGLRGLTFPAFALEAGGGGYFPSARKPRVAWLGFGDGTAELARRAEAVSCMLTPLGFPLEGRSVVPHATLFRVKDTVIRRGDPWRELPLWLTELQWAPAMVNRVVLWRSILDSAGAKHEVLTWVDAT